MAESTLALSYNDLAGEVGTFLGYGRGVAFGDPAWTTQQQNVIDSCVRSGLRKFYFPEPMEGSSSPYDWSFLKPTVTVDYPVNAQTIPLPDDFGQFEGDLTLFSTTFQSWWTIPRVSEAAVRQQYSTTPLSSGRPLLASLQVLRGTTATQGQRWQLFLFPPADQDYKLQFQYYVLADYLNGAFPYPLGGMAHAETILEACLSVAEQRVDDSMTVHSMAFMERLVASIGLDRRNKPQLLGQNRDRSDEHHARWRGDQHGWSLVTVNGVQY